MNKNSAKPCIRLKNNYVDIILPKDKKYSYLLLDDISGIIADKIIEGSTETEIVNYLFCCYDIDKDTIEKDLDRVISCFKAGGFLACSDSAEKDYIEKGVVENTYNELNRLYFNENKPFKVFLELTHNCNLKCKHCYLDDYDAKILTLSEAKYVMDQLYENDVVELVLTGGEIGLHPDLVQIVEYATKRFVVTLLTNGTLFNESLVKSLCEYPIYEVQISIYGMEELHNQFVGVNKNMWGRSIDSLKLFQKYGGIGKAAVVVNGFTYSEIDKLVNFLKLQQIEYFLTPVINSSLSGDSRTHKYRISNDQLQELFNKYKLNIGGNICTAGVSRFRVGPENNVYPCELLEHICFGNLSEQSFSEILKSDQRQEWIRLFTSHLGDKECRDCSIRNLCPSCIGMNFLENNDYNIKSLYSCSIANVQHKCLTMNG